MLQVTEWLDPNQTYIHKTEGEKTNSKFCVEVAEQVNKDKKRSAIIRIDGKGNVAVFDKNGLQK